MVKDIEPGNFICPNRDFVATSIPEVRCHMLEDCSERDTFSRICQASIAGADVRTAERREKRQKKKENGNSASDGKVVRKGREIKQQAVNEGASTPDVPPPVSASKRKGREKKQQAENKGASIPDVPPPVSASIEDCIDALIRNETPWRIRKVPASSLKVFEGLTLQDFQYYNQKVSRQHLFICCRRGY